MFDLKTRKRDFEHQLFFLLEKSQTSGRKSKFQAIERRKVARPRDRRAQSVIRVFFCLPRSFRRRLRNDLRRFRTTFHHHRSTPRNRPKIQRRYAKRERKRAQKKTVVSIDTKQALSFFLAYFFSSSFVVFFLLLLLSRKNFFTLSFLSLFFCCRLMEEEEKKRKKRRKKNWTKKKRSLSLGNKRIVSPFFSIIPSLSLSRL